MPACPVCLTNFSPTCPRCVHPSHFLCPQPRGISRPHRLEWGDLYQDFLRCQKCGKGFAPNASILDVLTECPGPAAFPEIRGLLAENGIPTIC